MASKDTVPSWGSPWDAILQAAKDQLPSLDSDSSLSDFDEGEPFIFQRNQPVLIPNLTEELAEDPVGSDKSGTWVPEAKRSLPEPVAVPVGLTAEPRSELNRRTSWEGRSPGQPLKSCAETCTLPWIAEETPAWCEGDLGSLSFNSEGFQNPPWELQGESTVGPEGQLETEPPGAAWQDCANCRALCQERRKMIEKDVLQKVTRGAQASACGDQAQAAESGARLEPVLSLKQLEEWDLDYILQSLPEQEDNLGNCAPRTTWWAADCCQGQDHTVQGSQDRILEQLVLLCATQRRASTSAQMIPAHRPKDTQEQEAGSRFTSTKLGYQAVQDQQLAGVVRPNREPPTTFIDLRQTEPLEPRDQSPKSSSLSSSESGEDEEEDTAQQASLSSRGLCAIAGKQQEENDVTAVNMYPAGSRDCTGKSQLLQQLRAFRKGIALPPPPASEGSSGQRAPITEDAARSESESKEEGPSAQSGLPGGHVGPVSAREALMLPLGQL